MFWMAVSDISTFLKPHSLRNKLFNKKEMQLQEMSFKVIFSFSCDLISHVNPSRSVLCLRPLLVKGSCLILWEAV